MDLSLVFGYLKSSKIKNRVQQKAIVIQALNDCSVTCNRCYYACFREEDVKMLSKCIQLERICSEICELAAGWMEVSRRKDMLEIVLKKLCMKICDTCAEECEKHSHIHCKQCADACRKCFRVCKN